MPPLFHDLSYKEPDQDKTESFLSSFPSHISQSTCVNNHLPKAIKTQQSPSQSHGLGISVMMGSWHLKREGDLTLGFVPPNPRLIAVQDCERFWWIHVSYLGFVSLMCAFFFFMECIIAVHWNSFSEIMPDGTEVFLKRFGSVVWTVLFLCLSGLLWLEGVE